PCRRSRGICRTRAASRSTACANFAIASANACGGSSRARVGTSCSRCECCVSAPSRGSTRRACPLWTSETGEEGREVAGQQLGLLGRREVPTAGHRGPLAYVVKTLRPFARLISFEDELRHEVGNARR